LVPISKKNEEGKFEEKDAMLARTIMEILTFEYPDTVYNLILQRKDNLEEILAKDFKLSAKLAEEFAKEIRACYKPKNLAASVQENYQKCSEEGYSICRNNSCPSRPKK